MKTLLAISLLASCALASGQDLNQKVTYVGPAAPAKTLLERLGAQTGMLLGTTPQTAGEVLVVHATDVPLSELLKRIAEAAAAEWKEETGGYRLVRPEIVARDQQRADIADRAEGIEKAVRRLMAPLEKQPQFDEASARKLAEETRKSQSGVILDLGSGNLSSSITQSRSQIQSPAQRALIQLLDSLPPATLAAIQPGSRVVFASAPNRMQRALGPGSASILARFVREQNTWARALADTPSDVPPANTRMIIIGGPDTTSKAVDALGKALLVVHRMGEGPLLSVEFKAADSKGQIVARANSGLSPDQIPPTGPNPPGKAIELSPQAQEYAELMAGKGQGDSSFQSFTFRITTGGGGMAYAAEDRESLAPVPENWRERLANPDRFEPLEFVSGEALRAASAAESRNLVACIPDSGLIPTCRRLVNAKLTPGQFLGFVEGELDLKVERPENWLLVSPRHPSEVRSSRIDRGALGVLLRSTLKAGYARLDEAAAYALKQPDLLPESGFDERTLLLLSPETGRDFQFNASERRTMLKLFGTLSPTQRAALSRGGAIPLGGLSGAQTEWVRRMVFDSVRGPAIRDLNAERAPQTGPTNAQESVVMIASVAGTGEQGGRPRMLPSFGSETSLLQERTEALPLGVPSSGALSVTIRNIQGVLGSRADGADSRFMSADQLAGELASESAPPGTGPSASEAGPYSRFRPATLSEYGFRFDLSPNASLGRELRDAQLVPGSQATGLDGLPSAFRAEVEQARSQLARAMQRMQTDGATIRRRGGPPPPE